MYPIHINFYLYIQMKKYFTLLKISEEIFSSYDPPTARLKATKTPRMRSNWKQQAVSG